jgi:nucleolar complex protein 3
LLLPTACCLHLRQVHDIRGDRLFPKMVKKQNWKKLSTQILSSKTVESSEDDVELDEEDLEFVKEFGKYSGFLQRFEKNIQNRREERVKLPTKVNGRLVMGAVEEIEEVEVVETSIAIASAEKKNIIDTDNRSEYDDDDDDNTADSNNCIVPSIKTAKTKSDNSNNKSNNKSDNNKSNRDMKAANVQPIKQDTKKAPKLASVQEIKESIATAANLILEDPQKHLKQLKLFDTFLSDPRPTIIKLGLLSLLQIYIDILPLYKIRKLSPEELDQKLSKDVLLIREYENSLLKYYQSYLQSLEKISKNAKSSISSPHSKELLNTCLVCISKLILSKPTFNFNLNLLTVLISNIHLELVSELCCSTIKQIFISSDNQMCRDCVKLLADEIFRLKYNVSGRVIETFKELRLSDGAGKRKNEGGEKSVKKVKTGIV